MNQPFGGPQGGPHAGGFGFQPFDPEARRAMHQARREARRAFRDHVRDHGAGHRGGPWGPGGGFGFGPGGVGGFGPGFAFGFGAGGHRGPRGRGRSRRGDVRTAILALLTERPMHGYEMIQEIGERSNGLWRPSPGSVYPTLQLLVDEGLIVATESEGSKKLFELTDEGRAAAAKTETPPWEEIAGDVDPAHANLRSAVGQLFGAVAQSAYAATPEQQQRIVDIVNNARREIYNVLGESE
ncbi:PadR family transcriptional regulator [Mycobacterium sp.]|jgi:DNA-binding PadR family transcriptional regulator|uniref:PadR family transcriptional regulator n=1 Tax=Mycobacterium sp. TaxID=1785 RepID=UPI002D2BB48B|nr:PadR family transcriptional regulator [Mycobacterium sp.]HZA11507.1 PadR family transcriptional regulator [Mycobacterium sp.]